MAEATAGLNDATAAAVQARVLDGAPGQTFSQFAQAVRRAVLAADPRTGDEQHAAAVSERAVRVRPLEHGMAELSAVHTADAINAAFAAIDDAARPDTSTDTGSGLGERNVDQRRADARIDLLTRPDPAGDAYGSADDDCEANDGNSRGGSGSGCSGGCAGRSARSPAVQVTVALSTLLGLDAQPGELAGYGRIPACLARAIAADPTGTWRRLVTDPIGQLVDYGRSTYRPPVALADHVRARDRTCPFATCNRRAEHCQLDPAVPWEHGGETSAENLQALCPRHHHAKHEAGWTSIRQLDDSVEWVSPIGHRYRRPVGTLPIDTTTTGDHAIQGGSWLDDDSGPP